MYLTCSHKKLINQSVYTHAKDLNSDICEVLQTVMREKTPLLQLYGLRYTQLVGLPMLVSDTTYEHYLPLKQKISKWYNFHLH